MLLASDVPIPVGYSACPPCSLTRIRRVLSSLRLLVPSRCAILACGCPGRLEVLWVDAWRLAEPGANQLVILAERWRWQRMARRRQGERDRVTDHGNDVIPGANVDDGVKSKVAGELDAPVDAVDRAARHASGAQPLEPVAGRSGAQPFNQQRAQRVAVVGAIFGVGKPGIMRQLREVENLAQLAKLPVVPNRDNEILIRRWQRFVGEQARMSIAHAGRDDA